MLNKMRLTLLFTGWLLVAVVSAEDVYRTVDEDGNIIFSDTPTENSEKIEIRDPQTIAPLSDGNFKYTPPQKPSVPYDKLVITSPANDTAIRENTGSVSVSVSVQPQLNASHELILYLDGKEYGKGGTTFNLSNVDRGTHSLRAVIRDSSGKILISSSTVTFHLLRKSVRNSPATAAPQAAR